VDDCTFWFTSMYIPINTPANRWRTHVGAFKFDSCGNAIPANNATFDPALQAPSCLASGRSCDSAATLVGRDTITGGAETNQPNTIFGSCADGTAGSFHVRESIDRIKVQTLDGTALAAGKTVRVDVTVWGWSRAFTDTLDVFFTANATSPTWTRVGSVRVTRPGAQTLSMTYTLSAGPLQAVRARFRYLGESGSCGGGPYDDHDDLAFAVQ
jgi:leucyl aminopeptidase